MPWGAAIGLAGTVYAADSARSSANQAADKISASANLPRYTNYGSSLVNGAATIDPSIRAMRQTGLQSYQTGLEGVQSGLGQVQGGYANILGQLSGNQNPFLAARINPLLQQAATSRGQLTRGLTNRGLGGSSFMGQSLANFDDQTGRQIGDAGALATQDTLGAQTGILGAQTGILGKQADIYGNLNTAYNQVSQMDLSQELQALGLSAQDTAAITQAAKLQSGGANESTAALGRGLSSLGTGISAYQNKSSDPLAGYYNDTLKL